MLLVWGHKVEKKILGRVADHCRGCGTVSGQFLWEVRRIPHIYWISLGSGSIAGHVRICEDCGEHADAFLSDYDDFVDDMTMPLKELIAQTNSGL